MTIPSEFEFLIINGYRLALTSHYVCTTETSRLMLFGETVAVYCENHAEHTDEQNAELFVC
jgi:hypothetical protein